MGSNPLTRKHWLLFCTMSIASSILATFVWYGIAALQLVSPLRLSLLGLCAFFLCFLFVLRLFQARNTWVQLWIYLSPWFLTSSLLFPVLSLLTIAALVFSLSILVALWGYYACFYPLIGLDARLHRARFANHHELADLVHHTPVPLSLLLGGNRLRSFFLVRSLSIRRELGNILIVGPTRSGKGLLATSQLLTWQGSVVVNDIKGDLFLQTAGYRATMGKVVVIDPTGVGSRYDPLHNKHTEDEVYNSAVRLLFKPDEGDGAIFTQRATAMLTQLFLAARAEHAPPLPYVREIIRGGLQATAKRLHAISPLLAIQFLDVAYTDANFTDRFLLSAWGTLTARMRPLLTETVIKCFAGADFTASELMQGEKPISVYFRWPEQNLLALSPLVRLLWGSLIDELITTYDKAAGKGCHPVLLVVDEAGRTAIPSLADHATTVVGRGISLWMAIQSLSQLEAVYGKARAQVLKDNMESQIYYRPTDLATAEYLEHRLGRKSGYAKSHTLKEGAETSQGRSEQGVPLLTAQAIMQLKDHEVIAFHRRLPPFRIRRVDWRHHRTLRHRHHIPVPSLPPLPALAEMPFNSTGDTLFQTNGYIDPDEIHIQ
jgi:type IV secretion system protein VirD4